MASTTPNNTTDPEVLERRRIRNREAQRRFRKKKTLQKTGVWGEPLDLLAFVYPNNQPRGPGPPCEPLVSPTSYSSSAIDGGGTGSSSSGVLSSLPAQGGELTLDDTDLPDFSEHTSLFDPSPNPSSSSWDANWDAGGWSDTEPIRCRFGDNRIANIPTNTPSDLSFGASFRAAAAKARFGLDGRILEPQDPSSSPGASTSEGTSSGGSWLRSLHIAARKGNDRIVRILLQHHTDSNEKDSEGVTPLIHAIIGGHEDVVRSLLSHQARICSVDGEDTVPSALHRAVVHRRENLLQILLAHCSVNNISVDCYDDSGKTPLHVAIDTEFEAGVVELLKHGADPQRKARIP